MAIARCPNFRPETFRLKRFLVHRIQFTGTCQPPAVSSGAIAENFPICPFFENGVHNSISSFLQQAVWRKSPAVRPFRSSHPAVIRIRRHAALLCALCWCVGGSGCVSRRLTVVSNPPGALVDIDGRRVGVTPVSEDFIYYGTHEITLSKPGFKTMTVQQPARTPWYQIPPLDFFSDNFLGRHVTDSHVFEYQLEQLGPDADNTAPLIERGRNFRSQAQVAR